MKTFIKNVFEWKKATCLMFTGSVIVYMLVALFFKINSISLLTLFSLLIISAVGTLLQLLCFTEILFKKAKYFTRLILFSVSFFVPLSVCAYVFNWVPTGFKGWFIFGLIFLIVLVGMSIGFEVYFKIIGEKYNGLLGQYQNSRENKE